MAAGQTKIGGALANQKKTNKSRMKTSTSERDNEIVRLGDQIVTPKKLITDKFKEVAQSYMSAIQEEAEKKKNQKNNMVGKASSSIVDSSIRSHQQSADKSSGSDIKVSSSNVQEKSSFIDSKRSDDTYSDSDSKKDQSEQQEKKHKKQKGLTEEDLDENIPVNLSETETMTLIFIPSGIVQPDYGKESGIIAKNEQYEKILKAKVGSDNYTDRPAQTFNYQPKQKDQQSLRIEKNDAGAFAAVWDLYDARMQDQLNEYEQLQEDIKKNIDKELVEKQKNPFFMLSTDVKAISIHSRKEVPGSMQFTNEKQQGAKTRTGNQTKAAQSSLSGGQTNIQGSGHQGERDDSVSSSSQTATKIQGGGQQPAIVASVTKSHGRTNQQIQQQQLLLQQQQLQQQLEEEEEVYLKEMVEKVKNQPSDMEQKVLASGKDALITTLSYAERILNQNLYHKQYIQYRNYPEVKFEKMTLDDDMSKRGPGFRRAQNVQKIEEENQEEDTNQKNLNPLSYLFKFNCSLSQDRTISCADWNVINQDLLAVSYGEYELNANLKKEGYLMFWTLKNPTYPERIIKYPSSITTCKFSEQNPNLIAAGTYDGVVAIYDIRRKDGRPVTENKEMVGKHNDVVWEVQWVGKGKGTDKGETLVSISGDSRIVEWSMKKGLEYQDLMNLKRQSHPGQKEHTQEGVNFRWTSGYSFDFLKNESSMYLAATEDGTVHRCSKSYAEQYLDSYFGHSGPVYKVRSNPFFSDIFLTCSSDWTCKLWNWREEIAIGNFQSLDLFDEVIDIDWSPVCSTLFASVCKDGRLELWDLTKNNMLDPFTPKIDPQAPRQPSKTMVRFAENCPVIITGDVAGDIQVYRLIGYEDQDPRVQQEKLVKLLYPTGYNKGAKERIE